MASTPRPSPSSRSGASRLGRGGGGGGAEKGGLVGRYGTIVALVLASALIGAGLLPQIFPKAGPMVGKPVPELSLPIAYNGEPGSRFSLSELRGSAVVIDFWASWCGPCAIQAPILERVSQKYKDKGVVVLGVSVDDPPAVARAYAAKKGLTYPIATDDELRASALFDVQKLPTLVVIDKNGHVVAQLSRIVDESTLDDLLGKAM